MTVLVLCLHSSALPYTVVCEINEANICICCFRVETHKNDVLRFCQSMSSACRKHSGLVDSESAELLWRFLELLIKQNGVSMVVVHCFMWGVFYICTVCLMLYLLLSLCSPVMYERVLRLQAFDTIDEV